MKTGSNWKKMEGKILLSEKTSMEMRAAWKKNIYLEILNSNDSKFLFIVNTTWQMTRWRRFKNSSNFTSWTTFTHQNAPFWKTTPFRNWKQCTAVMKHISVTWDCNAVSVTEIFCWFNKQVQNLKIVYNNIPSLYHFLHTDTLDHLFTNCMVDIHAKIHLGFP